MNADQDCANQQILIAPVPIKIILKQALPWNETNFMWMKIVQKARYTQRVKQTKK